MLRITRPSARSARRPTSFFEPIPLGPRGWLLSPVSTITSSGFAPEPSTCTLQRMHGPRLGIPWRLASGGGSWPLPGTRPSSASRLCALGHVHWYLYDSPPEPWSPFSLKGAHLG